MLTDIRYVRHRSFARLRHSALLLDFLEDQAARLAGTGTTVNFTADNTADEFTAAGHGFVDGYGPVALTNAGGALPAELSGSTDYFVGSATTNTFQLFLTKQDAIDGTSPVTFSDDGTGTHSIALTANAESIFNLMVEGRTSEQIAGLTSTDDF